MNEATITGNMVTDTTKEAMTGDERRSILTEREKEILSGEADVSEKYFYVVVSRVRKKIEGVNEDLQFLDENYDKLAEELREVVCK